MNTCPNGHQLSGGPVQWWCPCGTVWAADLDNEFRGAA
jgi:hypothetical protein